eukprot:8951616-Prorocentrum_lima.AAC.1
MGASVPVQQLQQPTAGPPTRAPKPLPPVLQQSPPSLPRPPAARLSVAQAAQAAGTVTTPGHQPPSSSDGTKEVD